MTSPFKLYGIPAISGNSEYDVCFNKEALERFCYNNRDKGYLYPFGGFNLGIEPLEAKETQTEQLKPDVGQIEVIEGVTIADIRAMIKSNRELGDVLQAVNQWRKLPPERKSPNSLYCNLNVRAKKNKWGLDNTTNEITKKQYENIGDVFVQSSKRLVGGKEERIYPKWEDAIKEN